MQNMHRNEMFNFAPSPMPNARVLYLNSIKKGSNYAKASLTAVDCRHEVSGHQHNLHKTVIQRHCVLSPANISILAPIFSESRNRNLPQTETETVATVTRVAPLAET